MFGGDAKSWVNPNASAISNVRNEADKRGWRKGWMKGNPVEKGRGALEKATGLDDTDVAKQFDPATLFNQQDPRQSKFRGQQNSLANMLMMRANGQAPSLADALARQQQAQGMNAISAQTASARGVNPALAARGAQMAAANLAGNINQQRLVGNLQEQQQAQLAAGQVLGQARGQDTEFQQMALNQKNLQSQALLQEALQRQMLNAQGRTATRGNRYDNWVQQQESGRSMLSAAGGAMAMSDERAKINISEISKEDVNEFLSAIKPKTFNYKDSTEVGAAEGDRIGFVLQDVQHTKLGKKLIHNVDGRLMYDRDNLNGIILAALKYA